jgi:hypothetical protein
MDKQNSESQARAEEKKWSGKKLPWGIPTLMLFF